jgi:hypothetical protein
VEFEGQLDTFLFRAGGPDVEERALAALLELQCQRLERLIKVALGGWRHRTIRIGGAHDHIPGKRSNILTFVEQTDAGFGRF